MRHELLIGRQRALLALDQLELLLLDATSESVAALVDARWSFARHMLAQMDCEEDHLFSPLKEDPRPAVADCLTRFNADRARLAAEFQAHARRYWTDESIASDPRGYASSLSPLLKAARDLLLRQKEELYALLGERTDAPFPPVSRSRKWTDDAGKYRSTAPASRDSRTMRG